MIVLSYMQNYITIIHWLFYSFHLGLKMTKIQHLSVHVYFNTLRLKQNGRHFPDVIFQWIFLNENIWIPIAISLKFVPKGSINNIPALVQIMAWRRPGNKPLPELMMVNLLTHICVTRPQWVNACPLKIHYCQQGYMGSCEPEAGIKGRDKLLHPIASVGCNYMSLSLINTLNTQALIYTHSCLAMGTALNLTWQITQLWWWNDNKINSLALISI